MSVTKRSLNVIKEFRNYIWQTDKDGRIINEPDHLWSHSMDAVRYPMENLYSITRNDAQEQADRALSRLRNNKPNR